MKKISIIGRGTAGVYSATHFLKYTDFELDLYFDNNIKPSAVGEGSTLRFPIELYENINFDYMDLEKINGTLKHGIKKMDWGRINDNFFHSFLPPSRAGYHFNAVEFQNLVLEKLKKDSRVKLIDKNVVDLEDVDSDFIISCAGRPASYEKFEISNVIPVNSVHVVQSFWEGPKFSYTLAIARPYGWVFAIPLMNRCSVGYLYNNKINTLEEVIEDMKNVFKHLKLIPSENINNFSFNNYYRKKNFTKRVFYNGNNSFFLEPLEASSMHTISKINRLGYDIIFDYTDTEQANDCYKNFLMNIEEIINVHYFAGSKFDTEFWKQARDLSEQCFIRTAENPERREQFFRYLQSYKKNAPEGLPDYGVWGEESFYQNIVPLGVGKELEEFILKHAK